MSPVTPRTRAGSDHHYARLYCPPRERRRLDLVHALQSAIGSIPVNVSDRGVARVKLDWWRSELALFAAGDARHDLTRAYLDERGGDEGLAAALDALVRGLDAELAGRTLADDAAQIEWLRSTFGAVYAACVADGDNDHRIDEALAARFATWIEYGYSLLYLLPLVRRECLRISDAALRSAGCSRDDLRYGENRTAVTTLVLRESQRAIDALAACHADVPRAERKPFRYVLTLADIVACTLRELQRDGCRVWRHRVELTPVRKLWRAWRCR